MNTEIDFDFDYDGFDATVLSEEEIKQRDLKIAQGFFEDEDGPDMKRPKGYR